MTLPSARPELDDVAQIAAERPDLAELTPEQLAPMELRVSGWPESWRELARSLYITLAFGRVGMAEADAAHLAADLMLGIAADVGGLQMYINQGADIQRSAMAARIIRLLAEHRQDYVAVAKLVGQSDRHIRRIEQRWLRAERARRQGELPL